MTGRLIFLHGLGQGPDSWAEPLRCLGREALCPNLPSLLEGRPATYDALRQALFTYCRALPEPLHLCGLSLGGVLALQYASEYPTASLVLIGTPLEIPRGLLRLQSAMFRLLPARAFRGSGFAKADLLSLTGSMADLELRAGLERVKCPVLLLCGQRDRANRRSAEALKRRLPQAALRWIPNAGHEVNRDAPEALAALLREFYASL